MTCSVQRPARITQSAFWECGGGARPRSGRKGRTQMMPELANWSSGAPEEKQSGDQTSADRLLVCLSSDVPVRGAIRVKVGELVLAVFNLDGMIFVTNDACTHGPGSLSEGHIEDDIVVCNFHAGAFNIRTGEAVAPPCTLPIQA